MRAKNKKPVVGMMIFDSARKCKVCGARVRNMNPKTKTCDSICTTAAKNGLTREQQIRQDLYGPYPVQDGTGCIVCGCRCCMGSC